ncbi:ran-specific GTPase-activating protein [Augochlora pura]
MPENMLNGDHVETEGDNSETQDNEEDGNDNDIDFDPIITLPLIEVSNNEEDEVELIKMRAKLYRYDSSNNPAEWKERGTGEVKLLRHKIKNTVRVVMRRDKTYKICANHFVTPWMELKPNCGSDRAWVWSVLADYADEQLKPELLAIRFANAENASMWKEAFEKAKKIVGTECEIYDSGTSSDVSYSESTDNEEEGKKQTGNETLKVPHSEIEKANNEQEIEKVSNEFEELQVKATEEV